MPYKWLSAHNHCTIEHIARLVELATVEEPRLLKLLSEAVKDLIRYVEKQDYLVNISACI